jgi:hypothetical protein
VIDLFAAAASDSAIPLEHWTQPENAERDWNECYGPHIGWDALKDATWPWEQVVIHPRKDGFSAGLTLAHDRVSGLWIFGEDSTGPISAHGAPPSYRGGGFSSRDAALSVGRVVALEGMAYHQRNHADYLKREREQAEEQRRARLARMSIEDSDETGEEGMADRFEDEEDEA